MVHHSKAYLKNKAPVILIPIYLPASGRSGEESQMSVDYRMLEILYYVQDEYFFSIFLQGF